MIYVAFSIVYSSATSLYHWRICRSIDVFHSLLRGRASPAELPPHVALYRRILPSSGVFRFYTCSFYSCSVLDFSFDCSEDFDINAFEDIISLYENKK